MKRDKNQWLYFVIFCLLFILSSCGKKLSEENTLKRVEQSDQIVWGVKNDTRLFGLMNIKTGQPEGFDIDIARALTKEILGDENKASFVEVISKTRIPLLKNGNIDTIIATMTVTPERAKQVDFSDVYYNAGQTLLVKKGSKIHSIKDLNEKTTVLAVKGSASTVNIRKAAPFAKVLDLESYAECFTALKSNQGDAMTTDNTILMGISEENPGYVLTGGNFTKEPYGIAVNKGQEEFVKKLNQALKNIRKNGEYERIYKKWFAKILLMMQ
jgi:putative glutamine transport system substrate-binding protein